MSATLTEFLLARITEDEANARSIQNAEFFHRVESDVEAEVLVFSDPARILAGCERDRLIVEFWPHHTDATYKQFVLRALALPYADHPDYEEEWSCP